jgi:hypothetical protein
MTETVSFKDYFERILAEKDNANDQRFTAQETAISKAEANRDTAIKKAEDSIEKKSDAVYVKLTDLQKAFSEVMLRPEIEGRLRSQEEKLSRVEKAQTESNSRGIGMRELWALIVGGIVLFFLLRSNGVV